MCILSHLGLDSKQVRFVVGRREWDDAVEDYHLLGAAADKAADDLKPQPPDALTHLHRLFERIDTEATVTDGGMPFFGRAQYRSSKQATNATKNEL